MSTRHEPVTLTVEERDEAIAIGRKRTARATENKRVTHFGANDPDRDPRGAIGERACACLFKVPWVPVTHPDKIRGDLTYRGRKIEVRASRYPNPCPPLTVWREIFCHDNDATKLYVFTLANLDILTVTVLGWCEGREISTLGWWCNDIPYPAYAIPVIKLRELEKLL